MASVSPTLETGRHQRLAGQRSYFPDGNLDTHDLSMVQFFKQKIEHAIFRPVVHTRIDGVPIGEALGQPTPFTARALLRTR